MGITEKGSPQTLAFVGKSRMQKRCFQPLDFPHDTEPFRSSRGKAIASARGMSEAAISNA